MKMLKQLIPFHKILFMTAVLFTLLSVVLNLCWNKWLAQLIDSLGNTAPLLTAGVLLTFVLAISESLSLYLSSYTCEMFAYEIRMGYAGYYLQCDLQTLSKLNVGEEQSAMQNEITEISNYLSENLFCLMKQFAAFAITVVFLFCQNRKLTVFTILPVIPLIVYCSFSGKIIKQYTQQSQNCKKNINGLTDTILELFPIVQIYDARPLMQRMMRKNLSEWGIAEMKKERICARLMSLSGVLSFVPLLLLLGFGGFMVINGEISMGIFYIFINLSGNVFGFLQNMPNFYAAFQRFNASVDRLEGKLCFHTQSL